MLPAGLVKLGAVLCLLLQLWGATGLDRASFCLRPTQAPSESACESGCCSEHPPRHNPDSKVSPSHSDGCCIQAKLPDDSVLPQTARDTEPLGTLASAALVTVAFIPHILDITPHASPPSASPPGIALGLASTRLRL